VLGRCALSPGFRSAFRSFSRPLDELWPIDAKENLMNLPGKRLILGSAVAVAALGAGGIAYAAGNDPVPEQGYVTVDDDATTPSPSPSQQNGSREDCPEKNGQGSQGQGSQGQGEQPSQPSQPSEQNPAGNA
jgi:hypothetical protein